MILSQHNAEEFSDQAILEIAYSPYVPPSGFLTENTSTTVIYVVEAESSANASSTEAMMTRNCTDNFSTALTWINKYNFSSLTSNETEKYFEYTSFSRDYTFRVHKCQYYDPGAFAEFTGSLGTFNKRPLTNETVAEGIQYIWSVNFIMGSGGLIQILKTEMSENVTAFSCKVMYLENYRAGDWNLRDMIIIRESIATLEKSSGMVVARSTVVKTVQGREWGQPSVDGNVPELFSRLFLDIFGSLSMILVIASILSAFFVLGAACAKGTRVYVTWRNPRN